MIEVNEKDFWEDLYRNQNTNWDMKTPTPIFLDLLKDYLLSTKGKMLVLGSGYGFDAIAAAKAGFDVTAIDFSETANFKARKNAEKENVRVNFLTEDIFKLDENYNNTYDVIYDYVTYCAVYPERRKEYAEKISNLIKTGGKFVIILFPIENRIGGPPFGVDPIEAKQIFGEYLNNILISDEINSIKPRKGREQLHIYKKI